MLLQLVHPLTVTLGLLALAVVLLLVRWRGTAGTLIVIALVWTYALATPAVSRALRADLEREFAPAQAKKRPSADAIVVLGGGVEPAAEPRHGPNLLQAADRVWYAAKLYQADKAPLIIATGARPYRDLGPSAAEAHAEVLSTMGVPQEAVVTPGESERTHTDARIVERVMNERDLEEVLLVTSALHMPRAYATFMAAGVEVLPAPTDYEVTNVGYKGESPWLPSTDAFWLSSRALHEYIGTAWYRYKGWI